jgi:hypothetical protein
LVSTDCPAGLPCNSLSTITSITATTLESKADLLAKYSGAVETLWELTSLRNVRVLHEVDAHNLAELHSRLAAGGRWDTIIWNFPYPIATSRHGRPCSGFHASQGNTLLRGFFASLHSQAAFVSPRVELHLTLSKSQIAGSNCWGVEQLADEFGFDLIQQVPFSVLASAYPEYSPRREHADESFPLDGAQMLIFRRRW